MNNIIKFYFISQPMVGLLDYYFKIEFVAYSFYIFFAIFSLYSVLSIKHERKGIVVFFLGIFSILCMSTLWQLMNGMNFDIMIFLKHFISYIILMLLFVLGQKMDFFTFFNKNHKFIYMFLVLDLLIILIFRLDILNKNVYPSFESSYLLPTYIYSLITHNKLMLFIHLLLFFLHAKRAVLILSILVWFIFIALQVNIWKKVLLLLLLLFGVIIFDSNIKNLINIRYLNIYYAIENHDLTFISSFKEKVQEVIGALSLKTDFFNIVFGNGSGWYYKMLNSYDEYISRHFTHFTIIFIFISNGLIGVLFFISIHFAIFYKNLYSKSKESQFLGYVILSFFLVSFSVLNLFTNPMYILFLGSIFKHKKILLNE
jgi:hypothetical protein